MLNAGAGLCVKVIRGFLPVVFTPLFGVFLDAIETPIFSVFAKIYPVPSLWLPVPRRFNVDI